MHQAVDLVDAVVVCVYVRVDRLLLVVLARSGATGTALLGRESSWLTTCTNVKRENTEVHAQHTKSPSTDRQNQQALAHRVDRWVDGFARVCPFITIRLFDCSLPLGKKHSIESKRRRAQVTHSRTHARTR